MTTSQTLPLVLPSTMKYSNGIVAGDYQEKKEWTLSSKAWGIGLFLCTLNYGSYAVLIHLSKKNNKIPYSSVSVVLLIETCKIIISLLMYGLQGDYSSLRHVSFRRSLPFAVPGVLYFINNNLGVLMQMHMDAITSQILSNLKIVSTAIFFRIIIKRHLSRLQWGAIVMLTFAGIFHSYGGYENLDETQKTKMYITVTGIMMITLYCCISGLAGVFSEYIVKRHIQMSIHLQNMMLYCYGILLNFLAWTGQKMSSSEESSQSNFFDGFSYVTWILIFSQAFNGLAMSFIVKHASNILRLFIIASSMMVTTVMSVTFLHTDLNIFFGISSLFVIAALYLYNL